MDDVNVSEVIENITSDWITAKELIEKMNLDVSSKYLARRIMDAYRTGAQIEIKKVHTVNRYRRIEYTNLTEKIEPEPFTSGLNQSDIGTELHNLMEELGSQGENVQMICYVALRNRKEQISREMKFVQEKAPTVLKQIERLQEEIKKLRNQIEDHKDDVRSRESKKLIDIVNEERDLRAGVLV